MTGNPDGLRSLARYSKLPIERVDYRADADAGVIDSIDRGIVFLMAFWSGPSLKAFGELTQTIARLDEGGDLELVVVDVDGSPALYEVPEFYGKVHAYGETAWIRAGTIVATSGMGLNTDCFEPNTLSLLSCA